MSTEEKTPKTPRQKNDGLLQRGGIWHMRFTVKGVLVAESTHTSNRREAERIKERRRSELVQQVVLGKLKSIKLHAAIDEFKKSRSTLQSSSNANRHIDLFKSIPNVFIDRVTNAQLLDVIEARVALGRSKSTNFLTVAYFNAMIEYLTKHNYSVCKKMNPIRGIKPKIRWLTEEEEVAFLEALNSKTAQYHNKSAVNDAFMDENREICILLLDTGARWHEGANMTWSQVNFDKGTVHVIRGKGGKDTTLEMSDRLLAMLTKRRAANPDDEHIFPRHNGKHCTTAWFNAAVKRAELSTAAGNVTPHTFRHTFAARLLHNGLGLVEVQEMLGHTNIQSTMVYSHLVPNLAATRTANVLNRLHAQQKGPVVGLSPEEIAAAYAGNAP